MGKVDFKGLKKALSNKPAGSSTAGKMPTYKFPKDTDTVILRLIPNPSPKGNNFKLTHQHPRLPGNEKKIIKCLEAYGLDCDVCSVLKEFDGRLEDVKNWSTRANAVANVLVKKDTTQKIANNVPHRVYFGPGFMNFIAKYAEEEGEDALATAMFDPHAGRDLIVNRKSYEGAFEFKFSMSEKPIENFEEIMAGVKDLDETFKDPNDNDIADNSKAAKTLKQYIKDRIQRQVTGTGADDGGDYEDESNKNRKIKDEEEDDIPENKLGKSAKPASKPAAKPKVDEQEEEAQEEQEEPPKKSAKPAATTKAATPPAKPKETKGNSNKPANAPECFGDANVYNNEDDDPCLSCVVSLKCKTTIDQARA